jgi:hypothetical protein
MDGDKAEGGVGNLQPLLGSPSVRLIFGLVKMQEGKCSRNYAMYDQIIKEMLSQYGKQIIDLD